LYALNHPVDVTLGRDGGHAGGGLTEQVSENRQRIELALRPGPKHIREHLVRLRVARRTIPAPCDAGARE